MFFTFPKDAHWTDRQAVEFGVEIGEYRGACSDAYFQCGPPPSVASRPTPSRAGSGSSPSCGRNGRPRQTADRPAAGSHQLIERRLGVFQVGGVEALGKRAVDWREQVACLGALALIAPQPREARRGTQFPGLGGHLPRQCDRVA